MLRWNGLLAETPTRIFRFMAMALSIISIALIILWFVLVSYMISVFVEEARLIELRTTRKISWILADLSKRLEV